MNILTKYNKVTGLALLFAFSLITFISCDEDLVYPDQSKLPPATYDTSNWTISDYSSQEDQGGEGDTGRAADIIDGNTSTFWHTCWSGCTPVPPHFITVDMKKENEVHGFFLVQRQSLSRNLESIEIQVSQDGSTWSSAGTFNLEKIAAQQELVLSEPNSFRYYKMIVNSVFDGSDNAALAELVPYIAYN
ncbi:carbohydrate binding module (CBM32) [Formosa agariphila KMM 3901]|uniref:Carbohydrate binding module (CBM32) n=1 Tax=Formosa agariphila (strain DSM 15362 / KCTC 12365 / LMG 23005 / KMM 3901 / M-2Alg 35-1) TaxID=1347342 RepID=T2KPE6_FORAG|nr:discoidin domain-containing protein [Formosa agariphila]CDF80348.1 carbohydrate binding module (CBM32) [Formosa agariphila KMM 3901]